MLKIFFVLSFLFNFSLSLPDGFVSRDVFFKNSIGEERIREIQNERFGGRLGGGTQAQDTDFPFAVEVISIWADSRTTGCTGAIIASFIILTSRHECMFSDTTRTSPTDVFVQAGGATRGPPRFGSFVASATWLDRWEMPQGPHPNFAIANLTDFLQMSPTINVIRLPSFAQSISNFDNSNVDVVGWGPYTGGTGTSLHWSTVTVSPFAERNSVTSITEYELACRPSPAFFQPGDNGGPVILREGTANTLIGLLWTQRISTLHNSEVLTFMQIGQFWDFIHDVTGIPRRW